MDLQGLTSICLGHESTSTGANSGVQRASIVAGFGDGRVSVYREFEYGASAESMFYACPGSNKPVSAVATSPASCIAGSDFEAVVLSGTTGGVVSQSALAGGIWSHAAPIHVRGAVTSIAVDPTGTRMVCATEAGEVSVADIGGEDAVRRMGLGDGTCVNQTCFVDHHTVVAVGASRGSELARYDLRVSSNTPVAIFSSPSNAFHSVCVHPTSADTIATGARDGKISLWDARTTRHRAEIVHHQDTVWSVAFLPDDPAVLLSVSEDGCCSSHDLEQLLSSNLIETHVPHTFLGIRSYSDCGTLAIVGADDDSVEIMKLSSADDAHFPQQQHQDEQQQQQVDMRGMPFGSSPATFGRQRRQANGLLLMG